MNRRYSLQVWVVLSAIALFSGWSCTKAATEPVKLYDVFLKLNEEEIHLQYAYPKDKPRLNPALIIMPDPFVDQQDDLHAFVEFYTAKGFSVFLFDYTGLDNTTNEMGRYQRIASKLPALLKRLRELRYTKSPYVCVLAFGAATHFAFQAETEGRNINALVLVDPRVDFDDWVESAKRAYPTNYESFLATHFGVDGFDLADDHFGVNAPLTRLSAIRCPILIMGVTPNTSGLLPVDQRLSDGYKSLGIDASTQIKTLPLDGLKPGEYKPITKEKNLLAILDFLTTIFKVEPAKK